MIRLKNKTKDSDRRIGLIPTFKNCNIHLLNRKKEQTNLNTNQTKKMRVLIVSTQKFTKMTKPSKVFSKVVSNLSSHFLNSVNTINIQMKSQTLRLKTKMKTTIFIKNIADYTMPTLFYPIVCNSYWTRSKTSVISLADQKQTSVNMKKF